MLVLGTALAQRVFAASETGLVLAPAASPGPALGSITAGGYHNCAVSTDGTLACWGDNSYGQSTPPAGTFTQVAADVFHTCGIKTDGTLACWGYNYSGQSSPPAGTFTQVAPGSAHTCGLKTDGTLACWGLNRDGQSTPPAGKFTQVAAGANHMCGLKTDGTLACWGHNYYSQSTPPQGTFTQLAAGTVHTCGLKTNGTLACWGSNYYSQSTPPQGTFTQLAATINHTCGLKTDGTLACWGYNGDGQSTPPAGTFTQVAAGDEHTCGLKTDGTLVCWGNNSYGQSTPPPGSTFSRRLVTAGGDHTCKLKTDGTLACWGSNDNNQSTPPAGTFSQVDAGYSHTCGLKTNGTLACWGWNPYGQTRFPAGTFTQVATGSEHTCGLKTDGTLACWGRNDTQSTPPAGTFSQIAAGGEHTCGLKTNATIACWGSDGAGQSTPPVGTFTRIAAGKSHTCGLKTDGTLACWGWNPYGQSTSPAGTFTQVAAGDAHTCGLKTNATIACWGSNAYGQSTPPAGTFTQVTAGAFHTCGMKTTGTPICWGDSSDGRVAAVVFDLVASSGTESTTPAVIDVVLSAASTKTITVKYATANGMALAGSDYTAKSGTLTFTPGQTSKTISVPIINNATAEGSETFTVALTSPVNAKLGSKRVHTYTINDEDASGAIKLSSAAYSVGETGQTVTITAMRIGGSAGVVSVKYATHDGTATAGYDYTSTSETLSWANGDRANKTIIVKITNDAFDEPNETFTVKLSPPSGGAIPGSPSTGIVTIVDDDRTPTVRYNLAASSGAEVTYPEISVVLSAASNRPVTVKYATVNGTAQAGSDYPAASGTLGFNPGETSRTFYVPITNDWVVEPNETFAVTLTSPVNAILRSPSRHVYTITNDDPYGSIRLSAATYSVDEAGGAVTITAQRVGGSSGAVGVKYATANGTATAGSDYEAKSGTLSWVAGDRADKTFTVPITNDTLDEPDETFTVKLSAPTGGATLSSPSSATVTIADDDPTPTLRFSLASSSGAESTTPAVIDVTLSAPSGRTVTVKYATANGTATTGSDYTARSGILTIAPGQTSKTISVPIVNNTAQELKETFTVALTTPVNATLGATALHTYTIDDEDLHGAIRLSSAAYSVGEAGQTVTITAQRVGGGSEAVYVNFTTANGTALPNGDYAERSGILSWATGDKANKTFTVKITNDGLDEPNETFMVRLYAPWGGAVLGSPSSGTVTITDDDPLPTVRFSSPASSGGEFIVSTAVLDVILSAPSGREVTVKYATVNGTALAGGDYEAKSGTLTFDPGVTSRRIHVGIVDDKVAEPNQSFAVTLSAPVNAILGAPYKHVYTIVNDDIAAPDQAPSDALPPDITKPPMAVTTNDFDGDGRSDYGVFDVSSGLWSLRLSTDGDATVQLGAAGSVPVTGDFDGDGRSDYGVFDAASGVWSLRLSTDGDATVQLGSAGSVAVSGDFDGDGRSDYGVFDVSSGIWSLRLSTGGDRTDQLGSAGSIPVRGDFDGDGRGDYGVFDASSGIWSLRLRADNDVTFQLGSAGSIPVTGDFDGDGVTDCGGYTPADGSWEIALSSGGLRTESLGSSGALPILGDFDGDGTTDIGCYYPALPGEDGVQPATPGSWRIMQSTAGLKVETFGGAGAIPIGGTIP